MGSVAQAVVEFDEAVQAPWRPPLGAGFVDRRAALRPVGSLPPFRGAARAAGARSRAAATPRTPRPAAGPAGPAGRPPVVAASAVRPVRGGCAVRGEAPRLRLTRRARRLRAVLILALGLVVGSWLGAVVAGGDGAALHLVGESSVVVESGDSLWSIASSVAGESDVRGVVDRIQELNGLEGTVLVPGQVLRVP